MEDATVMTFGQFMSLRREELGYTLTEAAEKIKVGSGSVQSWEKDENIPFASSLYKIAAAYELTPNDLQKYELKRKHQAKAPPIQNIKNAIKSAVKVIEAQMNSASQFETNMKTKMLGALAQCEVHLNDVAFLDNGFQVSAK